MVAAGPSGLRGPGEEQAVLRHSPARPLEGLVEPLPWGGGREGPWDCHQPVCSVPAPQDFLQGDCTKAKQKLNWKPRVGFDVSASPSLLGPRSLPVRGGRDAANGWLGPRGEEGREAAQAAGGGGGRGPLCHCRLHCPRRSW